MHNVSCFNESARDIRRAPPRERECIDCVNEGGKGKAAFSLREGGSQHMHSDEKVDGIAFLARISRSNFQVGWTSNACVLCLGDTKGTQHPAAESG
jgi:hypothetical protein